MTLIELVIGLALVGVMLLLGVSALGDWSDNQRAATSARSVADAFSLARSEAIRTGSNFILAFDIEALGGVDADIVIANDGPLGSTAGVSSDCKIEADEIVHRVPLENGVSFGSTATLVAPDDPGALADATAGTTFVNVDGDPASWVMFGPDGMPRRFNENSTATPPCDDLGPAGEAGAGIYLNNGKRDYAIVMTPLGIARLHRYVAGADRWTQ